MVSDSPTRVCDPFMDNKLDPSFEVECIGAQANPMPTWMMMSVEAIPYARHDRD